MALLDEYELSQMEQPNSDWSPTYVICKNKRGHFKTFEIVGYQILECANVKPATLTTYSLRDQGAQIEAYGRKADQ